MPQGKIVVRSLGKKVRDRRVRLLLVRSVSVTLQEERQLVSQRAKLFPTCFGLSQPNTYAVPPTAESWAAAAAGAGRKRRDTEYVCSLDLSLPSFHATIPKEIRFENKRITSKYFVIYFERYPKLYHIQYEERKVPTTTVNWYVSITCKANPFCGIRN